MKKIIMSLLEKAKEKGQQEDITEFLAKAMEKVKEDHPGWWAKQELKLHEILEGPHFNEEYATMIVDNMVNIDDTTGPHWGYEESTKILESWVPNNHRGYNSYDWWVILNMMMSDYGSVITQKVEMHVAMAKAYFDGPDEEEGKAWYQFKRKLKQIIEK